jgi:integrase
MRGSIRQRGENSFQLRYYAGIDPVSKAERRREVTFKGSRKEAEAALARLVAGVADGQDVAPSQLTLAAFLDRWESDWMTVNVAPKTAERYRQLLAQNVRPQFGHVLLQKLEPLHFQEHYARLMREPRSFTHVRQGKTIVRRRQPLAARTVGHVHRVLHRAFGHAVAWRVMRFNPVAVIKPPRVEDKELEIIRADQLPGVLRKLAGHDLNPFAVLALASGCRRGELAALTWHSLDLDGAKVRVVRSLEETAGGLREKSTKSRNGRRTVGIDAYAVGVMRAHRRRLNERRLAAGLGRLTGDDLVFLAADLVSAQLPDSISTAWAKARVALALPSVSLHGLRHTHASICIHNNMNVVTLSKRMGHHNAAFTLKVYGHLYSNDNDGGAAIMGAVFADAAPVLPETGKKASHGIES